MNQQSNIDDIFPKEYIEIEDYDVKGFIDYCEKRYKMTTKEFLDWYKDNDYEGDINMQRWAHYAHLLDDDDK